MSVKLQNLTRRSSTSPCETWWEAPEPTAGWVEVHKTGLAGWSALGRFSQPVVAASDVEAVRNKACSGSIPVLVLPEGGYLTPEATERVVLWDSDVIAFAYGCGPDAPDRSDVPNARRLRAAGKWIVRGVDTKDWLADGDLLLILPIPGTGGVIQPCQVVATRGVGGSWFETTLVARGVYALTEPGHYERAQSYLVIGERRAALIDTGMGIGNIELEVQRLTDKPILVVNTHSHYDHIGDNHRFAEVALFDTPLARQRAMQGISHAEIAAMGALVPGAFYRPWSVPQPFRPEDYRILPFAITHPLREGEVIDLGGKMLQVWHTPGHSADSICLYDEADRLLFTGDSFYPGTLYCHFADSDLDMLAQSAARLAALASRLDAICPSHNRPRLEPGVLVEFADALAQVLAGRAAYQVVDEDLPAQQGRLRRYEWPHFALLLSA